tara:strand:+ start:1681 stop:2724 length:1044 start_codon:yes stop_codon:yes gene_type:complete
MAINVNTVYTTVLSILNKEQRGYLTPDEFNKIGTQVQLEIFEKFFEDYNQYIRMPKTDVEFASRMDRIEQEFQIFEKISNGTYNSEQYAAPTDLHRFGSAFWTVGTTRPEIGVVSERDYQQQILSPILQPSNDFPIATYKDNKLKVYPFANTPVNKDVEFNYIRKPADVRWGFSVGSIGQYIYDSTTYDSTTGSLVVFDNSLTSSITTNTVNGIDAVYTGATFNTNAITTSGSGTGAQLTVTVNGNTVTAVTVTVAGSGYAVGDTITISDSAPPNGIGGTTPVVITLTADDLYSGSSYGSTNFEISSMQQTEVILEILKYAGIVIRDPQVIQAAQQELMQEEANQKR